MTTPVLQKQPIAGYEIKERIGAGGYGEVWKAEAPGGLVKAIKFIYGFLDEVRAAGELKALQRIKQVRHPFLLSLERIEIIESQLVIVTELADGCLKDRFNECRKAGLPGVPRDELLVYVGDAADALDYMNANFSLQHLDVKPENLLLVGGRVKVGDFGLVKDIHDYTVSLMGGLTPIYAPPEVFDGKPSHFSDQYSLAIVYQELLTGVLPFPGKSAAQLAAQHLHGQARLNSLPEHDQGTIRRALAKSPADRFPSCRAMVDELIEAGRAKRARAAAPAEQPAPAASENAVTEAKVGDSPAPRAPRSAGNIATEQLGSTPHPAPAETGTHVQPVVPRVRPAAVVVDLPPLECPPQDARLRPTLFVGIGGLAAATLRGLRRRLHERFGSLEAVPAIGMLLLDTNRSALCQATQGSQPWDFRTQETLALPLRRTQDYRRDSDKFLKWLSRRWLYNIPRSQETEGLRPLGRLAFVDHLEAVRQQLIALLKQIAEPRAAKASREATGIEFEGLPPRVVCLASVNGGTGSGIVLDAAYVARSIQRELGFASADVVGMLLHGTPCQATARELAGVNAYACLNELHHYGQPTQGYPGDAACRLPATSLPPFQHTYLIHLGDDLDDERFAEGTDAVAAYLYRDVATNAGPLLANCRHAADKQAGEAGTWLHTFGVCQIGAGGAVADSAVELLGRAVIDRWSGEALEQAPLLVKGPTTNSRHRRAFKLEASDISRLSLDCANTLELEFPRLRKRVDDLVEGSLGKSPVAHFAPVVQQFLAQQQAVQGEDGPLAVDQFVEMLDRLVGPRCDAAQLPAPVAPLEKALVKQVEALAAGRGTALADWLYQTCNLASAGAHGAQQAAEWFVQHLRGLEKETREAALRLRQEIMACEQSLQGAPLSESRATLLGLGRGKKAAVDRGEFLLQMAVRRASDLSLRCIIRFVQALLRRVGAVLDSLRDLRRTFGTVAAGFAPAAPLEAEDGPLGLEAAPLAMAQALQARFEELTENLVSNLSRDLLGEQGVRTLVDGPELMAKLPAVLRQSARRLVRQALGQVDLAGWLLDEGGRLTDCVAEAEPQLLTECGGDRRLFIFHPASSDGQRLPDALRQKHGRDSMVATGDDPGLIICCEGEHISLPRAAANLTDEWVDLPQMAARVRTRVDVAWCTLPD